MLIVRLHEPLYAWLDRRLPRGLSRAKPHPHSMEAIMADLADILTRVQALPARIALAVSAAEAQGQTEGAAAAAKDVTEKTTAIDQALASVEATLPPLPVAQAAAPAGDPAAAPAPAADPSAAPTADPTAQP